MGFSFSLSEHMYSPPETRVLRAKVVGALVGPVGLVIEHSVASGVFSGSVVPRVQQYITSTLPVPCSSLGCFPLPLNDKYRALISDTVRTGMQGSTTSFTMLTIETKVQAQV